MTAAQPRRSVRWSPAVIGAISSVGRAFGSHPKGHRFEPCIAQREERQPRSGALLLVGGDTGENLCFEDQRLALVVPISLGDAATQHHPPRIAPSRLRARTRVPRTGVRARARTHKVTLPPSRSRHESVQLRAVPGHSNGTASRPDIAFAVRPVAGWPVFFGLYGRGLRAPRIRDWHSSCQSH